MKYINVALNIPRNSVFTYKTEEDCELFGRRVSVGFRTGQMTGIVVEDNATLDCEPEKIREIKKVVDKAPVFTFFQYELSRWMSEYYQCSVGQAVFLMIPAGRRDSSSSDTGAVDTEIAEKELPLTEEQQAAVKEILSDSDKPVYLYGLTGSGKTEVFLQAAAGVLSRGKSVIYLVPEIALTFQLTQQVEKRFGSKVAVLHSGLKTSEKLSYWKRIISGECRFVVGARSAVFAPVRELGLVILDEEQETSYKSNSTPRYHARQVAFKRCQLEKAKTVLGSATPSLEAWHQVSTGVLTQVKLTKRVAGGVVPSLTVVDLKKNAGPLSRPLLEEIQRVYEQGKQTVLFINRRGFSYFFHCRTCGFTMKCRWCSSSMTYHKPLNILKCHYCGYQLEPVTQCPECASPDVGYSGFGTQLIEQEVRNHFPRLNVARMDSDSAAVRGGTQSLLEDMVEGKIDILLGTQMVAKGLNFPKVALVGIVLADTSLHMPDFRAAERTFSLLHQVAGRAGRFAAGGKVIIQTMRADDQVIRCVAENKVEEFYEKELEIRRLLSFPPYTRLGRIVYRGKDSKKVWACADDDAKALKSHGVSVILGPAECPISMISSNFRVQILVKNADFSVVRRAIAIVQNQKPFSGVYKEIDVDPQGLL